MTLKLFLSSVAGLCCLAANAQNAPAQKTSSATYVIPVVVHILHQYGPENISDAQVRDAIRILNEDFQMRNADTANIIPQFKGIKGNMDVEFRLAKLDPSGNCTNGITRTGTAYTNGGGDLAKIGQWDPSKYLNIWTVKTINNSSIASYAINPAQAIANPAADGIIIWSDYLGSIGTGSAFVSRALTHETARYMNLKKTWDGGVLGTTCGNDSVADTPTTAGWTTCNLNGSHCNPPVIENVQNFMEYAYCSCMFTMGQVQRVHACLNSAAAHRNNLWSPANLLATGTDDASYSSTVTCGPIADGGANFTRICAGSSVVFMDASYNTPITSRQWNFNGGTPAVSTASTQTVTYNNPGSYAVSLKVTGSQGSDSITKINYIYVEPATTPNAPSVSESFESFTFPNGNWPVSPGFDSHTWMLANVGGSGSKSIMIDNYSATSGDIDEITSPPMDLYNAGTALLTFKVAYAQHTGTVPYGETLKVLTSKDCGKTWMQVYSESPNYGLDTHSPLIGSYTPTQPADWSTKSVSIPAANLGANTRIKFQFTAAGGNNIYLDDINISSPLAVQNLPGNLRALEVLPNPFSGEATVKIYADTEETMQMELRDVLGKTVLALPGNKLISGENTFTLGGADLAKGLYFLNIFTGSSSITKKVVIQ